MILYEKHIAITIDDDYIQHACVMLESLKAFLIHGITIHCIYAQLSNKNIELLKRQFSRSVFSFQFYPINNYDLSFVIVRPGDHVSIATYFRILLPNILTSLEKVLFLDTDIIINGSIDALFNMDISGLPVAAVEDIGMGNIKKESMGIPDGKPYFNAGVLLMNLEYFRAHDLVSKILLFIKEYPERCEFWDQDALNATITGNIYALPYKYNVQSNSYSYEGNDMDVNDAMKCPVIIHFTGAGYCKPWFYHNNHPFKKLYYKHLQLTPFRRYREPDRPTAFQVFKRMLKRIIPKRVLHFVKPVPQ